MHDLGDDVELETVTAPPELVEESVTGDLTDAAVSVRLVGETGVVEWVECSARTTAALWLSDDTRCWVQRRHRDVVGVYSSGSVWALWCTATVMMSLVTITLVVAFGGPVGVVAGLAVLAGLVTVMMVTTGYRRVRGRVGQVHVSRWMVLDVRRWVSLVDTAWAHGGTGGSAGEVLAVVDDGMFGSQRS